VSRLEQRIAIVTGAGSGLGRAHALALAARGAAVVVNDIGTSVRGEGTSTAPAEAVVAEIAAAGGRGVASHHDVADWDQAHALIELALATFGGLDIVVNNAGILADRTLAKMSANDWDSVIDVHLKGHAATTAHAMAYWRARVKTGRPVSASLIHTTSAAALCGNFGQANYAAAKAGILALSKVAALEGSSLGVRSNAISPSARTRMAATVPGSESMLAPPADPDAFDWLDPANVSPLVCWLAEAGCPANDQVFHLVGGHLYIVRYPAIEHVLVTNGRWTPEALEASVTRNLVEQTGLDAFFEGYLEQSEAPTPVAPGGM